MDDIHPQIIKTEAGDLVVLTRAEFDTLLARASRDDEDVDDAAIFDSRMAELDAGVDARLPPEVTAFMFGGDSLLKALRKWRDMTQTSLSLKAGLAQGYISDLESGRKAGTPETLRQIATALDVDVLWLDVV